MGKKKDEEKKADAAENIKVLVRCRPLNSKEVEQGFKSCVDLDLSECTVTVHTLCGAPDRWTFDAVINNSYTQRDVFTQFIMPLVDSVLEGFNSTVFAYGQSGSGKTHTMTGRMEDPELVGIIPRTFDHIFSMIKQFGGTNPQKRYTLYVSFIELYNGKVRDLLAKAQVPLAVKENKDKTFFVQGATIPQVKFPEDILRLMEEGTERRQVASTELNADSSRSHSVFTIIVECTETTDDGDVRSVTSKLNLVDLAGSERQSKTGASGDTLKEGCNINLSLSALGTVIDTLVKGKGHVPFRSSPLTMLLKDSLGGSSKTVMFANIGPSEHNLSETISTLRFADRAKQIKNKPVVNMDTKDQKIAELSELVQELREKLKQFETGGIRKLEEEVEQLTERVGELEISLDNAEKGREADAVDFENRQSQLTADMQFLESKTSDMEEQIHRLTQDLLIAESCAKDEKRQRAEVLKACSDHLDPGHEITNVDELLKKLRDMSHGQNSEEMTHLQSQVCKLEVELAAAKEAQASAACEMQMLLEQAREEARAGKRKLNKLKTDLDEERAARKHLVSLQESTTPARDRSQSLDATGNYNSSSFDDGSSSAWLKAKHDLEQQHQAELQRLELVVDKLREEAESNAEATKLRAELESSRKNFAEQIRALNAELQAANNALHAPKDDDSAAVTTLKSLLVAKDATLAQAREHAAKLESYVSELKQQSKDEKNQLRVRRRSSLKLPTNGPAAAQLNTSGPAKEAASIELDVREAKLHFEQRDALRNELQQTAHERNILLVQAIQQGGSPSSAALADPVEKLTGENDRLRKAHLQLLAEVDTLRTAAIVQEKTVAEKEALAADRTGERAEEAAQEVVFLKQSVLDLQATISKMRGEFADKEKNWLAIIQKAARVAQSSAAPSHQHTPRPPHEENSAAAPRNMSASDLASSSAAHDEAESPLKSVLDALQRDKTDLLQEVSRLEREVMLRQVQALQASPGGVSAATAEEAMARTASFDLTQTQGRRLEAELRSVANVHRLEKEELGKELESMKQELEEERGRRQSSESSVQQLLAQMKAVQASLAEAQVNAAEQANKVNETRAEHARLLKDTEEHTAQVQQLEGRLKERSDQLNDLRSLLDKQKALMVKTKEKADELQKELRESKKELSAKDAATQRLIAEKEESTHRAMNKKLEALAEEHHKDLQRKDEEIQKAKKKLRKMELQVQKAKERYDEKVCEYEELSTIMEAQKVEAFRLILKQGPNSQEHVDRLEVFDQQEQIQSALQRAKEEQRRKKDMFANGENLSAVGVTRVAGPPINAIRAKAQAHFDEPAQRSKRISQAPPVTPPSQSGGSDDDYDF
jgi:hypothetical protein